MKVSILLGSYMRPHLLRLALTSIVRFPPSYDYEILVLNDGLLDETENVCNEFKDKLNIRYLFTGQRNLDGVMKHRVAGFALNIGIKQSEGDIIVLSCAEIYHLNNAIDIVVHGLIYNPLSMAIPNEVYFDQKGIITRNLLAYSNTNYLLPFLDINLLEGVEFGSSHAQMPYLMAIWKKDLIEIGGYDEDFTGYAGEDTDLVNRLKLKGLIHLRTEAKVIHLFHGNTCDGQMHPENPAWVHNWDIYQSRKGILVRNQNKEWGQLDG